MTEVPRSSEEASNLPVSSFAPRISGATENKDGDAIHADNERYEAGCGPVPTG